jgi:hypothetical protein
MSTCNRLDLQTLGSQPIMLKNLLNHRLIPSPHMLVLATSNRFLSAWDTFRVILASESHWLQPMLLLSVHWWPTPAGVGRV